MDNALASTAQLARDCAADVAANYGHLRFDVLVECIEAWCDARDAERLPAGELRAFKTASSRVAASWQRPSATGRRVRVGMQTRRTYALRTGGCDG